MKDKILISILIVEDDFILAERMNVQLNQFGFKDIERTHSGELAIAKLANRVFDIIFMDIKLDGEMTGIQTAEIINQMQKEVAIIYFSSLQEEYIFKSMQATNHVYFLPKPFNDYQLKSAIDYVLETLQNERDQPDTQKDFLFIKDRNTYHRISVYDIQYIEGGKNTITIHTASKKKFVISGTFDPFHSRINQFEQIIRVHRSFIINLDHVIAIHGNQLQIAGRLIPFSKKYIPNIKKYFPLVSSSK